MTVTHYNCASSGIFKIIYVFISSVRIDALKSKNNFISQRKMYRSCHSYKQNSETYEIIHEKYDRFDIELKHDSYTQQTHTHTLHRSIKTTFFYSSCFYFCFFILLLIEYLSVYSNNCCKYLWTSSVFGIMSMDRMLCVFIFVMFLIVLYFECLNLSWFFYTNISTASSCSTFFGIFKYIFLL